MLAVVLGHSKKSSTPWPLQGGHTLSFYKAWVGQECRSYLAGIETGKGTTKKGVFHGVSLVSLSQWW